jgi:D-amino-acid dehydrogenase
MDFDVIVLGAGIVGVSAAIHLQDRGRRVALVDRRAPGEETSFGNAGLIERSSIVPYGFPRDLGSLLRYARNRSTDLYWDYKALPGYTAWLARFWWESAPKRLAQASRDMLPLIGACVDEHDALIARAGLHELIDARGWIEAFRTPRLFEAAGETAQRSAREIGLRLSVLDRAALQSQEPAVGAQVCGAIHWLDPKSVRDPGALVKGYAALFEREGGCSLVGDATSLRSSADGWTVQTEQGTLSAKQVVLALGPWSDRVFERFGYRIPLRGKRGYHMHYRAAGAAISLPIVDSEYGYVVAPMAGGRLRLTTGVEIAKRDAQPTGIQLARVEPIARETFGLGARIDSEPWLGARPCTPDMRPVIGPAPRHRGLWFAFGHNHHGLTLGPVTGRLLAEMMTGEKPFVDPRPFRAERFG